MVKAPADSRITSYNVCYTKLLRTGRFLLDKPAVHVNADVGSAKRDDASLEIVLDEPVSKADDAKALGIGAGDFVSFDPRTVVTESGYIKSRHLDDKA